MTNRMNPYNDFAIPIAWPDQTARGDEKWMAILKRLGIVKNLNFKVGHAAIVLVRRLDGECRYFDFGRYITPRGYGRARSAQFDPRLRLDTRALFDDAGDLTNFEELREELELKSDAVHGAGRLLCSIAPEISFSKASAFAEALVDQGPVLYGAIAPENNSCSRYVAQILVSGMKKGDQRIRKILYPESLKASPTSNVVNAVTQSPIFYCQNGRIERRKMNRWDSLKFQIGLLKPNFFSSDSKILPDDQVLGFMEEPFRPDSVPSDAHWLGGLGEGCWFHFYQDTGFPKITRYNHRGEIDYCVYSRQDHQLEGDTIQPRFSYNVHHQRHTLLFGTRRLTFNTSDIDAIQFKQSI
ncbi:MAG: DUF6695 family protein [Sphingobacterium sp.]